MNQDLKVLYTIKAGADELKYDGETKVEDYRHKYSVLGTGVQSQLPSGVTSMIIGEEKAEYQPANKHRGVLRTTKPIEELLSPDNEGNSLP
ncbi:MAG: hypothetical protein ACI9LV_000585 [Candidatus Nanohaloarchaea archaeon]|jgi:hypothetical protein